MNVVTIFEAVVAKATVDRATDVHGRRNTSWAMAPSMEILIKLMSKETEQGRSPFVNEPGKDSLDMRTDGRIHL